MVSNRETGALLLAASVHECVSMCVCVLISVHVGGTGCLAESEEEQTDIRRGGRKRGDRGKGERGCPNTIIYKGQCNLSIPIESKGS